jgi:dTDP-4-dehydrorhamnose reductase
MKVFIAGNRGMLAFDLARSLESSGMTVAGSDLPELDITSDTSVRTALDRNRPAVMINCAAYTAVDRAETDRERAMAVNGDGPGVLARACSQFDIPLIHISTDFIFDGSLRRPYREDDAPNPLSVYGVTKLAGEELVRGEYKRHLIVRTAWLYGVQGGNFVKTMLRLARERDEIRVVNDQTGSPTWSVDLADALNRITGMIGGNSNEKYWGTYHFADSGMTTWHGFASSAIEEARHYEKLKVERIVPITSAEYTSPVQRPSWSVLDTGKITAAFGIVPPPWEQSLHNMVHELYANER